jgi:hypothetical protein
MRPLDVRQTVRPLSGLGSPNPHRHSTVPLFSSRIDRPRRQLRPCCPSLRWAASAAARRRSPKARWLMAEGPRFSTPLVRTAGLDVDQHDWAPAAALSRETEMCCFSIDLHPGRPGCSRWRRLTAGTAGLPGGLSGRTNVWPGYRCLQLHRDAHSGKFRHDRPQSDLRTIGGGTASGDDFIAHFAQIVRCPASMPGLGHSRAGIR